MNIRNWLIAGVTLFTGAGCSSAHDTAGSPDGFGTVQIKVTQAPSDVSCISATAMGASVVTTNFDVAPGSSTVLSMTRVPVGTVSFSANAYSVACSALAGQSPGWVSNTVTATVTNAAPVVVTLTMSQNGSARVNVDFPASATCASAGTACDPAASPTTCCSGLSCATDPMGFSTCQTAPTCGNAGAACMTPADCCAGLPCVVQPTTGTLGCGNPTTCQPAGAACMTATDCCSGLPCVVDPTTGTPVCGNPTTCQPAGAACMTPADCCSGLPCVVQPTTGTLACGIPTTCQPVGAACTVGADCCSGACVPVGTTRVCQ